MPVEMVERVGSRGVVYQVESESIWDDRKRGHIRVVVGVDDGGWRAFYPLTDSFIIAPDGTYIGE